MDKNAVVSNCPTGNAWLALDSRQKQNLAAVMIENVINQIEQENRGPDPWESGELLLALGAAMAGMYALACTCVAKSLTPAHKRGQHFPRDQVSIAALRKALNDVQTMVPQEFAVDTFPNLSD